MNRSKIGVGTTPNDGTGDPLRTALVKANDNFARLWDGMQRRVQIVATHGQLPINVEGGGTKAKVESQIYARLGPQACSNFQVAYCNFYAASGAETMGPNDYTLRAAILRQSGGGAFGQAIPLTVGGAKNPVISAGAGIFLTDPLGMDLDAGTQIAVRSGATFSAGGYVPGGLKLKASNDKMATDATLDQVYRNDTFVTTGGAVSTYGFSPVAILGVPEAPMASVVIWGDSIGYGQGDGNDGNGNSGWIERGLWNVHPGGEPVPFSNLSRSGDRASGNGPSVAVFKRSILKFGTHCLVAIGTNDISQGDSLDTITANLKAMWLSARRQGCRVHQALITPKTNAEGTNASIFSAAYEPGGIRDLLNDWIIAQVGTLIDGYVNPNTVLEDPANHGFWKQANYAADGLHPSTTAATAAAAVANDWAKTLSVAA